MIQPIPAVAKDALDQCVYQEATVYVKNGSTTELTIKNNRILEGGFVVDRYTTKSNSLEMGTAISAELSLRLNNHDGLYDETAFIGKTLVAYVWFMGTNGYRQSIPVGVFTVVDQTNQRGMVTLMAYDNLALMDKPFNVSQFTPYMTVHDLAWLAIRQSGLTPYDSIYSLPNGNKYIVKMPRMDGVVTRRNVLMWCAGMVGRCVFADGYGHILFRWYDTPATVDEGDDIFVTTESNRYSSEYSEQSGVVTIDGISYTDGASNDYYAGNYSHQSVSLTGNPLLGVFSTTNSGKFSARNVVPALQLILNDILDSSGNYPTFIVFSASVKPAPYLWPMDPVQFSYDAGGGLTGTFDTSITHTTYVLNGATQIAFEINPAEVQQQAAATSIVAEDGGKYIDGNLTVAGNLTVGAEALLKVVQTSAYNPGTLAAGATFSNTTIDVSETGWTPIGVVGWRVNTQDILIRTMRLNGSNLEIEGKNVGSSSRNPGIYARILYLRTGS